MTEHEFPAGIAPDVFTADTPTARTTAPPDEPVVIDCDSCAVRMLACGDCVVSVLLGGVPDQLEAEERRALDVLADSGLVPPLRLVTLGPAAGAEAASSASGRAGGDARAGTGAGASPWQQGRARSRRGGGYAPPAAASTG